MPNGIKWFTYTNRYDIIIAMKHSKSVKEVEKLLKEAADKIVLKDYETRVAKIFEKVEKIQAENDKDEN